MIQNFNFYDIYGYLLPGLAFLGLLWLPFGLLTGKFPATEWSSAVVGIAVAYIAGLVLQNFTVNMIPSTLKDSTGRSRYPSDLVLDAENHIFSSEFKQRLAEQIRSAFGIEIGNENEPPAPDSASGEETVAIGFAVDLEGREATLTEVTTWSRGRLGPKQKDNSTVDTLSRRRQDAFFQCRAVLIKSKSASYAEQFEGMYTLMRGLSAGAFLGAVYHLGWASGGLLRGAWGRWSWLPVCLGLALAIMASLITLCQFQPTHPLLRFKNPWWAGGSLMLALFGLGSWLARTSSLTLRQRGTYLLLGGACILVSLRCMGAYKAFALEFPKAVYRGFYDFKKSEDAAEEQQ